MNWPLSDHIMDKAEWIIFGTLFFAMFVTITGVGIVVPLLPVYAHELGAGGFAIGMIFGAFSLSRTFFLPWFGRLSDKQGRRPFIVYGLLAYAVISGAFILSATVFELIAIRFVQGAASAMIMPVVQAYVGDITPLGKEGVVMGAFNMSMFVGLSIGPVLGGVIHDHWSLNASFAVMGIFSLGGTILCAVYLPPVSGEKVADRRRTPLAWRRILMDRTMGALFLFRLVYTVCIGMIWAFLPVYADSVFSLSSSAIGVLMALGVGISGIIHIPMGMLADRWNKPVMVFTGGAVVGLSMVWLLLADGFWNLFWANVAFGVGGGVSMPALMALGVSYGNRGQRHGLGHVPFDHGPQFGDAFGRHGGRAAHGLFFPETVVFGRKPGHMRRVRGLCSSHEKRPQNRISGLNYHPSFNIVAG